MKNNNVSVALIVGNDNSSVNVDIVKQHSVILRKFLEHKTELQLQALYALQALVHAFNHPQGNEQQHFYCVVFFAGKVCK
jgi:hypothetical protein